jgi:hypothetical protein
VGGGAYHIAFHFDVGALGEELVDEVEPAVARSKVERGHALLIWWSGGAGELGEGGVVAGAEHESGEAASGEIHFVWRLASGGRGS